MENYESILAWMLSQLPMYQKKGAQAYRPDLSRMEDFLNYLSQPQDQIKTIHVAGTNGKGSTTHMMASVLQQHGLRVGLYTSPHLKDFRERIKINGKPIDKEFVVDFVQKHRAYFESHSLSFFEMTVGLAFSYFSKKKVNIAIIEVGMGGRLDGTNLISPELSVITNIGFDHTQFLGNSLQAIAGEKAGIIKSRTPVVIGATQVETQAIFMEKAKALKAEIIFADQMDATPFESDLKGTYQRQNIQTATVGLQHLKGFDLHPKKIEKGLMNVVANTGIQGRWQVLSDAPMIVADIAHNKEGLQYTIPQIQSHSYGQLHLVLGFVKDKAVDEILRLFPQDAQFYLSAPQIPRALSIDDLERIALNFDLSHQIFTTVETAFLAAKRQANADDFIYVGGSTFVVAEIL
ncbi:bifunctional folylpolyglutamate synthase/dihydrofolate synthase [Flavobacteriaceae bacterium]|nr:bifunctional folylpolyglutamate synthase/dihydrofolate synthase [Flavobacteriaceae bacterium]MDC3238512.1 bifunctional folylpolyglutamate synthase/dihydrofolate synthase [Flavobacteriaceae bacterium]